MSSNGPDQPVYLNSLIRGTSLFIDIFTISNVSVSKQWRLSSDYTNEEADLELRDLLTALFLDSTYLYDELVFYIS